MSSTYAYARVDSVTAAKKGKTLLYSFEIEIPEGQVTAIMGPSGSGKTTFLNFLTGNVSGGVRATGEVELPGEHAFVPQDDRLHGFYTVQQYMMHYSRLCGKKVDQDHIDKILTDVGLFSHKDTIVGDIFFSGLSGGQKRRLSVALEALSSPDTLFLDEPTSGLDSESAYRIMEFLKKYARAVSGRRVILTIHQPSSFLWEMVDHLVLLSKGQLIYGGRRQKAEDFFASYGAPTPTNYNPADHYCAIINDEFALRKKTPDEWADLFVKWKQAEKDKKIDLEIRDLSEASQRSNSLRASFSKRVRNSNNEIVRVDHNMVSSRGSASQVIVEITKRSFLNLFKNPGILGTRIAMYVMLSLMIGALFFDLGKNDSYASVQSRIALNFYCVAFFVFMSVALLPFTVMERAIIEKEVRNGYYHPALYQVAQAIVSVPGAFILALLTSVIVVSMTEFREPLWYFLNMFLALCCAEALSILVSYLVPHFIIGIAIVAGIYGMFMILQGFMIIPSEFPGWLSWAYYIAFHTYSWRTFMYNEFHGDDVKFDSIEFPTGKAILELYEIEDVNPTNDMIVLICYALGLHLCSVAVLHLKYLLHKEGQV